jgi:D-arabinose 1-dehydrogenase-like Zn-dependent alcohol dehydrogenase
MSWDVWYLVRTLDILLIRLFYYFYICLVTNLYMYLMGPVDLKKKYKAKWALVTGAGTGIGKSLAETMAAQGLNVVLVSLPDKFLEETTEELKKNYPDLEFRAVPAKFDHKTDYMPGIIEVKTNYSFPSLDLK